VTGGDGLLEVGAGLVFEPGAGIGGAEGDDGGGVGGTPIDGRGTMEDTLDEGGVLGGLVWGVSIGGRDERREVGDDGIVAARLALRSTSATSFLTARVGRREDIGGTIGMSSSDWLSSRSGIGAFGSTDGDGTNKATVGIGQLDTTEPRFGLCSTRYDFAMASSIDSIEALFGETLALLKAVDRAFRRCLAM